MKNRYSPAVLRLAQEHGIDLETLQGTGREGRITRKDVLRYLEEGPEGNTEDAGGGARVSTADHSSYTQSTDSTSSSSTYYTGTTTCSSRTG